MRRHMERMLRMRQFIQFRELDELRMELYRTFGIHTFEDTGTFALFSGRLQFIQRAIRAALDRRRRQAYQLLRRILLIELSRAISLS